MEEHERMHDHDHDHGDEVEDVSGWAASAATALSLGAGLFCPACNEASTNPGFQALPPD